MCAILSFAAAVVGALLFFFAKKLANQNRGLRIALKGFGGVLFLVGAVVLYLLLAGKIALPISRG